MAENITKINDCWVSPYGEVVYLEKTGRWLHAKTAGKILNENYGYDFDLSDPHIYWLNLLHSRGWIRYSNCMNTGWIYNPYTITEDQKQKIFELTGEIIDPEL